jgi:POT family proton-dependent oligopeptide transporter
VLALMVLFIASVLFWAGYEQTGSSLNLFAERYTDRHLFGLVSSGHLVPVAQSDLHRGVRTVFSALWVWLGAPPAAIRRRR